MHVQFLFMDVAIATGSTIFTNAQNVLLFISFNLQFKKKNEMYRMALFYIILLCLFYKSRVHVITVNLNIAVKL